MFFDSMPPAYGLRWHGRPTISRGYPQSTQPFESVCPLDYNLDPRVHGLRLLAALNVPGKQFRISSNQSDAQLDRTLRRKVGEPKGYSARPGISEALNAAYDLLDVA